MKSVQWADGADTSSGKLKTEFNYQHLEIHPCTEEELSKFYPLSRTSGATDKVVRPHLQCFDNSQFKVQGNLLQSLYIRPIIRFKIPEKHCRNDPEDYHCVTSASFEESLKYKQIVLYTNNMYFDTTDYDSESPIKKESVYKW